MQFPSKLISGILIKRYKRFLADVRLDDGHVVTAHCPNTGAMTACHGEGWQVWLSKSDNPKRKLGYTWELTCDPKGHFIGVNTQTANRLVEEALEQKKITALDAYPNWQREVKYGEENSRIDFYLSAPNLPDCYVEVKSATLLEGEQGYFPDTQTVRGQKHLRELMSVVDAEHRAVIIFCAQHTGINSVQPAAHIDPVYADLCRQAINKGVEFIGLGITANQKYIQVEQEIPIFL